MRLISAPQFRLKGAGWYETDFKGAADAKRNLADSAEPAVKADDAKEDKVRVKPSKLAAGARKAAPSVKKAQKKVAKPVAKTAAKKKAVKKAAKKTASKPAAGKKGAAKKKAAARTATRPK